MWYGMHGHQHDRDAGPRGGGRGGWGSGPWSFAFDMGDMGSMPGRGRGGRRRVFDGDELRLVLLKLIADEPRHGYDLIRRIEELTGGAYAPSPGVVYPTLTLLDEMGLIAQQPSDDAKKRFAATDEGHRHLDQHREQVDALFARLAEMNEERAQHGASPIWRAVRNLGMAIRSRQARGGWSDDTLHDVAALIDEVAQKIERLR